VTPFGWDFIVRCTECGEINQVHSRQQGKDEGRDHQRWSHPTDEEREQDGLRNYEWSEHMESYCARCGVKGHRGRDCTTVTPDLLKGAQDGR
jgi:hypothetical protein